MTTWRKNTAGVKDGAACYRTIGGRRWEWFAEDPEQLRAVNARCRKSPGGGCFVHPDDSNTALAALAQPDTVTSGLPARSTDVPAG